MLVSTPHGGLATILEEEKLFKTLLVSTPHGGLATTVASASIPAIAHTFQLHTVD